MKVRKTSEERGWILVSDTAWPGYEDIPSDIMAGYGTIFRYPHKVKYFRRSNCDVICILERLNSN